MTPKQKKLAKKYGTPEQFRKALKKAWEDLFITSTEVNVALDRYQKEWDESE